MKIAVYGREFHPSVLPYVKQLFDFLGQCTVELWVYDRFYDVIQAQLPVGTTVNTYATGAALPADTNFMLSLGGDGTMLAAVSIVGTSGIPVAGINFGRLGFLASINKDKIAASLTAILNGDYVLEPRSLLSVSSDALPPNDNRHFALNDITIFKYDSSAMITVEAHLNGELLNAYWADGIIIATPTGSTAYSLSCGGPIMIPGSGNFVITPVSPHNLNVRPVVISNDFELDLNIESRSGKYLLSCDSDTQTLDVGVALKIRPADFKINLLKLESNNYFETLRHKLLWGLDARNY